MKSILDPSFRYVSSLDTDLRKTFARVRRELRLRQEKRRERMAAAIVPLRAKQA